MVNSSQGRANTAHEWVEIWNRSTVSVALDGWTLEDNHARDALPQRDVPPGGFALIAASPEALSEAAATESPPNDAIVIILDDGRIGNGPANSGDIVTLMDPAGRPVDSVDYRSPPTPLPGPGRSIALRDGAWILNIEPSPGEPTVRPLFEAQSIDPSAGEGSARTVEKSDAGSGIPAWALVAIALGVPLAALAAQTGWRRRPRRPA